MSRDFRNPLVALLSALVFSAVTTHGTVARASITLNSPTTSLTVYGGENSNSMISYGGYFLYASGDRRGDVLVGRSGADRGGRRHGA
jgi:hypothetical protein